MKRLNVKVIPHAKKAEISFENGVLKVKVNAPAVEGKANKAVVEALADYFKVRKSAVRIIKGEKSREKVVEIEE